MHLLSSSHTCTPSSHTPHRVWNHLVRDSISIVFRTEWVHRLRSLRSGGLDDRDSNTQTQSASLIWSIYDCSWEQVIRLVLPMERHRKDSVPVHYLFADSEGATSPRFHFKKEKKSENMRLILKMVVNCNWTYFKGKNCSNCLLSLCW